MAEDGWRYRVYDVRVAGGRPQKTRHESADASHRVFVSADGMRRSYSFARGEVRSITAAALERQLQGAQFLTEGPLANRPQRPR